MLTHLTVRRSSSSRCRRAFFSAISFWAEAMLASSWVLRAAASAACPRSDAARAVSCAAEPRSRSKVSRSAWNDTQNHVQADTWSQASTNRQGLLEGLAICLERQAKECASRHLESGFNQYTGTQHYSKVLRSAWNDRQNNVQVHV